MSFLAPRIAPRIAIDARYVRERPSGIGAMVRALVRRIPWRMPNAEFLLLRHPRAELPLCRAPNVREVEVSAEANGLLTLTALGRVVDLRGVDLFHATFNILPAAVRAKTIVTVHDVMWLDTPALCGARGAWGLAETLFYRAGIRRALRDATMILTPSEASRDAMAHVDPRVSARTRVVPLGVDACFRPSTDAWTSSHDAQLVAANLPGVRRFVLAVGQSSPYKNHAGVVRAFCRAFPERNDVHLVVVERLGARPKETTSLASQLGVASRVHVLGAVADELLLALYRSAIALCHPSFAEGFGMPVAEALASGCPVVTSERSSMPEVARDAALYVDPGDVDAIARALVRCADEPILRRALVARGVRRAEAFDWDAHVDATARAYEEVLDLAPASARDRAAE